MTNGYPRAIVAALLLVAAIACKSASYESEGDGAMREARFSDALTAYRLAEKHGGTNDKVLSSKIREAYIATNLQIGREYLFQSDFVRANSVLQQLAAEAPESPKVREWLAKAEQNLSRKLTEDGKERMGVREYESAVKLFEKALQYNPQNTDAKDALERAKGIIKWRAEKGELLWKGGLRAISEGQPEVAESKLSAVGEYTNAHPDADDYLSEVRAVVGDSHYRLAVGLEKKGQWFAALQQYKKAKNLHASPSGMDAAIERVEKEVKADQLYHSGKNAIAQEEFEKARERLQKALSMTQYKDNQIAIEAALALTTEKQNEKEHRNAVDLELEGRLADAISALENLDKRAPAYHDTRERMDRLKRQLNDANSNYKEAVAKFDAGDFLGARAKLKAALFLQPFMPEARAKLKEVEAAIATKKN